MMIESTFFNENFCANVTNGRFLWRFFLVAENISVVVQRNSCTVEENLSAVIAKEGRCENGMNPVVVV
jgi:hypothetical protein